MSKEYRNYYNKDSRIPYSASHICFCLTQYAKDYILENRKNIINIDKDVRDAVLVDAINYLGSRGCCDFALYTKDLYDKKKHKEEVEAQSLLIVISNHYAYYMFKRGIVESVLRSKHMNNCTKEFDANDGAMVLLDFINYIAKRNGYDKKFTIKELYDKYKIQKYNCEMYELKKFLELTGEYNKKLLDGQNIDDIFSSMAQSHNLKYVGGDGTYHYTDIIRDRVGQSEMYFWDAKEVDDEIYAMSYAYSKLGIDELSKTPVISKKILEMKKRTNNK